MSRCIFCKHCKQNWDEDGFSDCCVSEYNIELSDAILCDDYCNDYEPRPQQELNIIKAGLESIGINVEE